MKPLSLQRMKNAGLPNIWERFLIGPYIEKDRVTALQMIMLFIASGDSGIRRLGYRLSLLYAKHCKDASPIHTVASMIGLVPVSKISGTVEDSKGNTLVVAVRDSFAESLKENNIYLTAGQKELQETFLDQIDRAISIVAPTSYGKSSLMSSYLKETTGNFCVIVPTKSLLAQTRRMLLQELDENALNHRKIITHHEMYSEKDDNIIAVLTQERYLRLLQISPELKFEHLIIDESHNLFDNDSRSRALASTVVITLHRNPSARIKFLSPFIADSENLRNRIQNFNVMHVGTDEYVKSELIHYMDFRSIAEISKKQPFMYDQFMDRSYPVTSVPQAPDTPYAYLLKHAGKKNIIYLNRPKNTHDVARELITFLPEIENYEIQKACNDLGAYLNKDYFLISCIRKGVIFHHGSVPDNVRLYLEQLYSECEEIRFVVTTSTLLEGVNLPAEKMFLFDIKKGNRNLSTSQLKNLIGRVSRFKEVFAGKDVTALLPEIHFVGNEYYPKLTKNLEKFISHRLKEGKVAKDKVENPLLTHSDINDDKTLSGLLEELTFIGNSEEDALENMDFEYNKPKTGLGRFCYLHRISDFNVLDLESAMDRKVQELKRLGVKASNAKELIETVNEVFLKNLPPDNQNSDSAVTRLRDNFKARDFYAMILEWRTTGTPYQVMISRFIGYWKTIEADREKRIVFAGNWGNRPRTPDSNRANYIDIEELNHSERVTLSIARIESEMSFLDYNVMKYVDCLQDLDLIAPDYADQLKFGTIIPSAKELIKAGMSHSLAQLLILEDFKRYLIHFPSGAIGLKSEVIGIMENRETNSVLVNEAKYHTR